MKLAYQHVEALIKEIVSHPEEIVKVYYKVNLMYNHKTQNLKIKIIAVS